MLLIIDANILISAMLKPGFTRTYLMLSEDSFCSPANILEEIEEHAEELATKLKTSKQTILLLAETVLLDAEIHLVPLNEFKHQKETALINCPDKDDVEYFALALHLNCPIWSNDKELKKQSRVKIITTKELIETSTKTANNTTKK